MSSTTKVLFVCLGNICRSPLAEALFLRKLEENHVKHMFEIDSAGTSDFHAGENADARTIANAKKHGLDITHQARQFRYSDFSKYDIIVTMDKSNFENVIEISRSTADKLKVSLLLDHVPGMEGQEVPDPWYGGEESFEEAYKLLEFAIGQFLGKLLKNN